MISCYCSNGGKDAISEVHTLKACLQKVFGIFSVKDSTLSTPELRFFLWDWRFYCSCQSRTDSITSTFLHVQTTVSRAESSNAVLMFRPQSHPYCLLRLISCLEHKLTNKSISIGHHLNQQRYLLMLFWCFYSEHAILEMAGCYLKEVFKDQT